MLKTIIYFSRIFAQAMCQFVTPCFRPEFKTIDSGNEGIVILTG